MAPSIGAGIGVAFMTRRGANQAPPGSPISTQDPVIASSNGGFHPSTLSVASTATWTNSPTAKSYQWMKNGAAYGTSTTTPQDTTTDGAGNYRLTETATNAAGTNYANSNTIAIALEDTTPDAFTFQDVSGATPSTVYESNTITVSGINKPSAISITGGSYSKNGGAYTTAAGTVVNGDTVKVRNTSSASNSTAVDTTLTIGGVSDTFTITTAAAAATAPAKMAAPVLTASPNAISVDRANSTANGGSAITRYDLRYGTDGANYTVVEQTADPQTISGLTNGTAYRVSTRAVNAVGAGDWSDDATATPQAAATAPAQMAAPTLTPGDSQITVARAAAPSDGGSAITSYDARYSSNGGSTWTTVAGIAASQVIGALTNGTAYQVQTRAVNAVGAGAWSASATATPVAAAVATFSDNFAGDANLGDRTGWTFLSGTQTTAQSISGQLATVNTAESVWQSQNLNSANHYAEARLVNVGTNGPFLCCRLTDVNNWVGVRNSASAYQVFKRVGGTLTSLGGPSNTPAVGDMFRVEVTGDTVTFVLNGVSVWSGSLGGDLSGVARQGVVARTAARNPWIDDYKAGNL